MAIAPAIAAPIGDLRGAVVQVERKPRHDAVSCSAFSAADAPKIPAFAETLAPLIEQPQIVFSIAGLLVW